MVHDMDTNSTIPEIKRYVGFSLPSRRGLHNESWKGPMRKGVRIRKQDWLKIYVVEQEISGHDNSLCRTSEVTLCSLLFLCLNWKKLVIEYLLFKKMMLGISMWLRLSYSTFYSIYAGMELRFMLSKHRR